ncbi:hypothetical protein DFW101_2541 [Solidesulfovibrio carbinoliphilus subsp. oakridgensis]|uniref:Lipocalin-like domain-containing protein n=2 Tax=Solidesulfovibrio carbinoliphilus TaxID=345370 RepID=G7Q8D3_9BACT|nr:hypothetical protein DFW101_2541 [Solidesulfovibrio carbinoliphilus subsp. oakridgensis]
MKTAIALLALFVLVSATSVAVAQDGIPSLLGKWDTESRGGLLLHGKKQGNITHWEPKQKVLKGRIDVTGQDGRFVSGTYTSARGAEKFIGMVSADGKSLYAADLDGIWDARIVDNDTLEIVYRHVKPTDTVVAIGIAKRQK